MEVQAMFSGRFDGVVPTVGGDPWKAFDCCNVPEENRLLLMVWLIAAFIPNDFQYPALLVSGSGGSGKSYLSKILKRIVDPADDEELHVMPKKNDTLYKLLAEKRLLALDGIIKISNNFADRICSAISNSCIEKRVPFSDTESIVIPLPARIVLDGIAPLTNRTDLLDRSISIRLEQIPTDKSKTEDQLDAEFRADLPGILGGIADTLSKAVTIHSTVNLKSIQRLPAFTKWGFAVAEALGNRGAEFIEAYRINGEVDHEK
jgi:energy-coupling factor transporter ATP-binding protein EcfA2